MKRPKNFANKGFLALFAITALIILLDFAIPGQEHIEKNRIWGLW